MPAAIAVAGIAGSVYAAKKGSSAAKDAANTQAQSAKDANQLQWQIYQQQRQDNEPFRQNALTAQQEYMALLGLAPPPQSMGAQPGTAQPAAQGFAPNRAQYGKYGPSILDGEYTRMGPAGNPGGLLQTGGNLPATQVTKTPEQLQQEAFARFRNTPGYQFGLQTGFDQVQASAAARGGLMSGATLKALQKFGNDYADQQGYTPYMNRLASLAGMGQTANAQNAQMGMNYANQAGNNLINAGNARASGIQNSANAWSQGIGNAVGIGGWLAGQYGGGGTNAYGWRGF